MNINKEPNHQNKVKENFYAQYKDYFPLNYSKQNSKNNEQYNGKENFYAQYKDYFPISNSVSSSKFRKYFSLGLASAIIILLLILMFMGK